LSSVYIHIPFCERKCVYCDFYSVENHQVIDDFIRALHQEIKLYSNYGRMERVETIYFGGGTPSLFSPKQIEEILIHIGKVFSINSNPEITLEVNPGTVDREKLKDYNTIGVNRLSIGIQSFNDNDLRFLTRIHSSEQAIQSIIFAKGCGFNNISIDLIYNLPDQTLSDWKKTLKKTIQFEPEHISAYGLIVEENTPLTSLVLAKQIVPSSVEQDAAMYEHTMDMLQEAGYEHYEISNYAKSGYHSKHNMNYWNHSNYLGFGPSAHSFWSGRRWWNIRNLNRYCDHLSNDKLPVDGEEILTEGQLFNESIMLGLRTGKVDLTDIKTKYRIDIPTDSSSFIEQLVLDKHAFWDGRIFQLTSKGFLVCDEISQKLLALY
jgi:oxygen-independent coproporphyrinogen-3 oxidase